jgi:hypothetical protein
MVKSRVVIIVLVLIVTQSCKSISDALFSTAFHLKPCTDSTTFQKIDTTAVYKLVEINGDTNRVDARGQSRSVRSIGNVLKFFKNGRVVEGYIVKEKEVIKGLYCIDIGNSQMEFRLYHVQSDWFSSKSNIEIKADTLYSTHIRSAQGGPSIYKYVKSKLVSKGLIFTPNW